MPGMSDQEINEAVGRKLGWEKRTISQPGWELKEGEKGWEEEAWFRPVTHSKPSGIFGSDFPDYCGRIEAAWQILTDYCDEWHLDCRRTVTARLKKNGCESEAEADTAPMAICVAFLKLDNP